ncbi:hypothetical protein Poly30_08820 [Planctomycetes bacterium Poly30]|uniref:Uncharacterized protein n=1 Tax=Saltatorellus ferox TaxID=2528018 RepID=A0A518EMS4_9BACT|nr:hypothetical protein Poly30_08820 [Planctomycetes bacterium Poly30]
MSRLEGREVYGWLKISNCYLLLGAKGPVVGWIPPLKLGLEFYDVTGYLVPPISSSVETTDTSEKEVATRP